MANVVILTINVTSPNPPPPGGSSPVLKPNPVTIEAGKSTTVGVFQADGTTPWPGPIVPFWGSGQPTGVSVTNPVGTNQLVIDVSATAQVRAYALSVDCR